MGDPFSDAEIALRGVRRTWDTPSPPWENANPQVDLSLSTANPRPHMLFPRSKTHIGGPHAISPLIEIELWDKKMAICGFAVFRK